MSHTDKHIPVCTPNVKKIKISNIPASNTNIKQPSYLFSGDFQDKIKIQQTLFHHLSTHSKQTAANIPLDCFRIIMLTIYETQIKVRQGNYFCKNEIVPTGFSISQS